MIVALCDQLPNEWLRCVVLPVQWSMFWSQTKAMFQDLKSMIV
jgi:hypothetical protein